MRARLMILLTFFSALLSTGAAGAENETDQSITLGAFHPNGINMVGYSVESQLDEELYWYYSFGFPTVAAIGITYYADRDGNGLTSTLGTSLGSYAYASVAYQMSLGNRNFLKLGAGVWAVIDYGGSLIPVISYEHRF